MVKFTTVFILGLISGTTLFMLRSQVNLVLMRFFRDVGRFKARKRLYGNDAALIPILLGKEEPLNLDTYKKTTSEGNEGAVPQDPSQEAFDGLDVTPEELARMDGRDEDTPIYVAVLGSVYDVSAGRSMYGPRKGYNYFAGTLASCIETRPNACLHLVANVDCASSRT